MKEGKFFYNDVQVTEEEYYKLLNDGYAFAEQAELLKAKAKEAAAKTAKPAKAKSKAAPVKKAVRGSKTAQAAEIVKNTPQKDLAIAQIQEVLGVTKSNANTYYYNVTKKLS